ncbi:MAG: DUF6209 family protein [Myxococcaceae bacterium]
MRRLLVVSLAACTFACAPAEQHASLADELATSDGDITSTYPTVTFESDWSISTTGTLIAGQPVKLRYALSRLERCRASSWQVYVRYFGPTSHRHDQHLMVSGSDSMAETWVILPFGDEVEFAFEAYGDGGCHAIDTNYERNHRVAVSTPAPTLHFLPDWSLRTTGTLKQGTEVTIDFDVWRLPFCVAVTQYDTLFGDATMFYRFDGGPVATVSLLGIPSGLPSHINGQPGQFQTPPRVAIPAGARELEVWFLGGSDHDPFHPCTNWDSNYGYNYRFEISP